MIVQNAVHVLGSTEYGSQFVSGPPSSSHYCAGSVVLSMYQGAIPLEADCSRAF